MNEKLQYRAMLDIPENTASVTLKPQKKKKTKKKETIEDVKEMVIEKVNETVDVKNVETETVENDAIVVEDENGANYKNDEVTKEDNLSIEVDSVNTESTAIVTKVSTKTDVKSPKNKIRNIFKKPSLIKVQVGIIGVLIGVILLTSVINKNSGINVFMRNVFAPSGLEDVDERLYTEFEPVFSLSSGEIVKDENGVITTSATGAVYSPLSGVVESVNASDDGVISVIIKHSENFSSKIDGLKFVYLESGQKVTTSLPLGYAENDKVTTCFMGEDGEVIKDYKVTENSVVWAV